MRRSVIGAAAAIAATLGIWAAATGAQSPSPPKPVVTDGDLTWEVQYLIDTSQSTGGISQFSTPRSNRGVGLSSDGRYLYLGYNEPNGSAVSGQHDHQVRMIDTTVSDFTDATLSILTRHRGKSIATDDKGRVYLAEGSDTDVHLGVGGIHIRDAGLGVELAHMSNGSLYGLAKPEGVTTTREGGVLVLYVTDRSNKRLHRFVITEAPTGDGIVAITKAGLFTGTGQVDITGASDLRGVKVDSLGRIWMADLGGGKVFRCEADGSACVSTPVPKAMDIGLIGSRAYVTQSTAPTSPTLVVLRQDDLGVLQTMLAPPWAGLKLDPLGQKTPDPNHIPLGQLAGAAATRTSTGEKLLYIANERGQTEHEQSVYGRCDASSDNPDGPCVFTDVTIDDNEPVFRIVEPNFPPVANCQPIVLDADAACHATGSINDGSYDPDRDLITFLQSVSSYDLGQNQVTLTVTDQFGAASSCNAVVTVRDVTPPTLACPAPVFASTPPGSCSAIVNPGSAAGADNCSVTVTGIRSDGLPLSAPFAVGTTTISWSATDTVSSVACSEPQTITVAATNPIVTITSPAAGAQFPVGSTVTFSATYTGDALGATWTFNGSPVAGTIDSTTHTISASYTFTTAGTVSVGLTVSNGCGGTGTAAGTIGVFVPATGRIGDFVWNDLNFNGIQNTGEPGLAGVTVQLKDSAGNVLQTTTTSATGFYQFTGLAAGSYTVVVVAPTGFVATVSQAPGSTTANDSSASPVIVTLATDSSVNLTIDFGFLKFATGYTTYTQGGWGATPSGNNPGALLKANFTAVYPGGSVTIGGVKTLKFTRASAIEAFLPQGSTASVLKVSATNPLGSAAGVFAGQVLALRLNVDFSNAGLRKPGLGSLTVITGPLAGYTVNQVLALANTVLGGTTSALPAGVTVSILNGIVDQINNNFDNGTDNDAYLR